MKNFEVLAWLGFFPFPVLPYHSFTGLPWELFLIYCSHTYLRFASEKHELRWVTGCEALCENQGFITFMFTILANLAS